MDWFSSFSKKVVKYSILAMSCPFLALNGADWSTTEIHYQLGQLKNVATGGDSQKTNVFTLQHASGWKYGDNFFFVDWIKSETSDHGLHAEWYPNISLKKTTGYDINHVVKDVGLTLGLDVSPEVNFVKYMPGIRFDWDVKRFAFLNTLVAAYIDDSDGTAFVPAEENSWIIDTSYKYPFSIRSAKMSLQGHFEYVGERDKIGGGTSKGWFLSQMQFRYDLGHSVMKTDDKLYLGFEWQYWENKLGNASIDENAMQFLTVWAF